MGGSLVTGAPGWLGNQLVRKLVEDGREVRCLVLPDADASELRSLGVEVVNGDVTQPDTLRGAARGCDVVYHAAGIVHPGTFTIGDLHRVNVGGTANVLREAVASRVRRFVFVSSNSAAGVNRRRGELMDETTPERPYLRYGASKRAAEELVRAAYDRGEIETSVIRPCWYYGPGQPERQTRLMRMVREGKAPMFGDGSNLRSMTYVESLCEALMIAAASGAAAGRTYWIADERPYTTREIYEAIAEIVGVELRTANLPGPASSVAAFGDAVLQAVGLYQMEVHVAGEMNKDIACSVERAKAELGYRPPTDLREGMRVSYEWAVARGLL